MRCVILSRSLTKNRLNQHSFGFRKKNLKQAYDSLDADLRKALTGASRNITAFYRKEKKMAVRNWSLRSNGKLLGQKWNPIKAVGVYVPGGKFSYPSTVLMTVIPARIAGVQRIVVVSPPGKITRDVLAAAWIAGVDEFYQVGGPAGIAALAYGTKTILPVDKIIGPGNAYVTLAKKMLYGIVGIDMLAGPSEVAIVADNPDDFNTIIQDMKAQKEHDADAEAVLISFNRTLAENVKRTCPWIIVKLVRSVTEAVRMINSLAPEHVQLMTRFNSALLKNITAAGTVCVGKNTPVALGDYAAGPSHVLPTGRTARFSSGLSVLDFFTRINIIQYTSYNPDYIYGIRIAGAEGMREHRASLQRRIPYGKKSR